MIEIETSEISPTCIKVIGVGGGGCNAVNRMVESQMKHIEFITVNTDLQALTLSPAHTKIQIGVQTTRGLGAGTIPEVGEKSAIEDSDAIKEHLTGSHMVFITAGMGGGTGTGASPIIAKLARDLGILTVAVVTRPFTFEGPKKMELAEQGIKRLSEYVDAIIIIPNQNLLKIIDRKFPLKDAFRLADEVLYQGVKGISDLITVPGHMNADFADIRTIMKSTGEALMGLGSASGDGKAAKAAEQAITNPLIDGATMEGAKGILINVVHDENVSLYEVEEAVGIITSRADKNALIKVSTHHDENLSDEIKISVIATGFKRADLEYARRLRHDQENSAEKPAEDSEDEDESSPILSLPGAKKGRIIEIIGNDELEEDRPENIIKEPFKKLSEKFDSASRDHYDIPAFLRQAGA